MAFKWKRQPDELARVVPKKNVDGFFRKSVILSPNEKGVLIKEGEIEEVIESGKLSVGGLLSPGTIRKDVDVALIDTSPKDLQWKCSKLWTADNQSLSCSGVLRFRVMEIKRLFQMIFAYTTSDKDGERNLSVQDVYKRLESEVITLVLEPEVRTENIENIYGNRELRMRLENELEMKLRSTLEMWGLEMLRYTIQWDLGSYGRVMEATNQFQTEEELAELKTLGEEGKYERFGRVDVAQVRASQAPTAVRSEFVREERLKEEEARLELERLRHEADMKEALDAIALKDQLHISKAKGMRAELEVEQDMKDREHYRDMDYISAVTSTGGADVAKTISEGREYAKLSSEQLEALAKVKQSEVMAKEDKVSFMMDVEDRERADAYRRHELDAGLMGAASSKGGSAVKRCSGCGSTIPAEASFCSQCGKKLE